MKSNAIQKPTDIAAHVIGAAFIFNGIWASISSNFSVGQLSLIVVGALFILLTLFKNKIPDPLRCAYFLLVGCILVVCFVLNVYGNMESCDYTEDAIIVLGASVDGDKPTPNLANRLDRAVRYHEKNPNAVIVVSGGQGPQETVTEAQAMKRYLTMRGVDESKILTEERATSTYENFLYSKAILDDYFKEEYSVVFVTNSYHIFRATNLAKIAGLGECAHATSKTEWEFYLTGSIREIPAIAKMYILSK